MSELRGSRVLLGPLEPILVAGLRRVLGDDGMEVLGPAAVPREVVSQAGEQHPDVVVLDLNGTDSRALAEEVRRASPQSKVILWARDETLMEILDPGSNSARLVITEAPDGLRAEMVATGHQVKE